MEISPTLPERFEGCIVGGAIGDAWGSSYENVTTGTTSTTFHLAPPVPSKHEWSITDDTQLTVATCEAIAENEMVTPAVLAAKFVQYHKERRLSGLGASTLKAIQELQAGGHWSQVGRSGEYAAGNGAAMRIAPFAFFTSYSREHIRDFCRITHRNDEAYAGALAVVFSLKAILSNKWNDNNLLDLIIPDLPDTNVRDRLVEIVGKGERATITEVACLGNNGYAVNAIPFAIFAASKLKKLGFEEMLRQIIAAGGDTDTNASVAGQIAGCYLGSSGIPRELLQKLEQLDCYNWLHAIITKAKMRL